MTNWQSKARIALGQHEGLQNDNPANQKVDDSVALGGTGQVYVEQPNNIRKDSPSSTLQSQSPDDRPLYNSQAGIMSTTIHRSLSTPTSTPDVYNSPQSAQPHASYASQWLQQQTYFPPGSEGRETSGTPSPGTGQIDFSVTMDQSEWS